MITALAFAKALLQRVWWSTPFLILAIGMLWWALSSTNSKLDAARTWGGQVLTETQDAALNPKLIARDVPAQIRELGKGVAELREGLNRAKSSALAAAKNDADRRAALQQQMAVLTAQDRGRQSVIDRLAASAARPAPAGACEASDTLKGLWQ